MMKQSRHVWYALMVHALLFFSFSLILTRKPIYEEKSAHYVPAYVIHEVMRAIPKVSSPQGIEKKSVRSKQQIKPVKHVSQQIELTPEKNINKPLLKILHDATAAKLIYPDVAIDFQTTGTASIAFYIQPNGAISQVSLIKSSGSEILDNAALDAVKAMSPVKSASLYVNKTQHLSVDVIFK